MFLIKKSSLYFQKKIYFILLILFLHRINASAQNDTLYFDQSWKNTSKELAAYYRIKPLKIKTREALSYKIKDIDSVYSIKDYYSNNNKLQFEGFSTDPEGEYLVGKSKWYDENSIVVDSRDFNNKTKHELPKWPILFVDYKIARKSQFIGGLEFCLDCENKNKLFIGAGYGVTSYNHTYYGLPDLHLSYNTEKFWFFKGGTSDKHVYVMTGVTFLNILDLGCGYSLPFNNDKIPIIKGFTFGATFRLARDDKKVYTQIKIM
jgi:hypothetical protein